MVRNSAISRNVAIKVEMMRKATITRNAYAKCLCAAIWLLSASATRADPCQGSQAVGPELVCDQELTGFASLDLEPQIPNPITPKTNPGPEAKVAKPTPGIAIAPMAVQSIDNGVSMRSSIDSLRDYNAKLMTLKAYDAKAWAPANMPVPKAPVADKSPLDLWTKLDVQGTEGAGDAATRIGVGADYKLGRDMTVGMAAERGDVKPAGVSGTQAAGTQTYDKLDAHVRLKALSFLSIDGRTNLQSGNADYAAANGASEKKTLTVEPRLGKSFGLENGNSIEPFVSYKREIDVEKQMQDAIGHSTAATQSAGAGVTLSKPDNYALSFTTDVTGIEGSQSSSVNSKVQLKLPLP